ncbi:hypothetical protein WJR50_17910 [Catalinimonas sp. 4WD22]|uniref:hypothetical protein n=1 Tax=Catalinimonas locisalis TaxID=3133978 RepID=UPI003101172F
MVVIIVMIGGVFTFLGLTFVNSKGCSQIVIDTNELHSDINIPEVESINCYYDEQKKIRVSVYRLKMKNYYDNAYVDRFRLIDSTSFSGISQLAIAEQPIGKKLKKAKGTEWGNTWKYVVEPETGTLWVEIMYD